MKNLIFTLTDKLTDAQIKYFNSLDVEKNQTLLIQYSPTTFHQLGSLLLPKGIKNSLEWFINPPIIDGKGVVEAHIIFDPIVHPHSIASLWCIFKHNVLTVKTIDRQGLIKNYAPFSLKLQFIAKIVFAPIEAFGVGLFCIVVLSARLALEILKAKWKGKDLLF